MVDFFLLVLIGGAGDELQGIKRGIMEMADGIVINKADGSNIEKAKLAASHFRNALHLFPTPDSGWTPKVLTYSVPTRELNSGLLHCRQIFYHLSCQGSLNLVGIVNVIEIIVVENARGRIYI